jgi:hypothetical protein
VLGKLQRERRQEILFEALLHKLHSRDRDVMQCSINHHAGGYVHLQMNLKGKIFHWENNVPLIILAVRLHAVFKLTLSDKRN